MQQGKNQPLFFQTLPSQTPKQVKEEKIRKKIDEVYGKGYQAPYDDDGAYGQEPKRKSGNAGFRMVKNNLTGRQMKIAKQTAPFDEINGADFTKLREALRGRGMANAKIYQGGTGRMEIPQAQFGSDGYETAESRKAREDAFDHNEEVDRLKALGQHQELGEGPFSQAVQSMDAKAEAALVPFAREFEQALSNGDRWAEEMREEFSLKGFSMDDIKSGSVPAHTVLAVADGGQGGRLFREALINHAGLKEKDANYLNNNLRQYGRDIEDGEINVTDMDKMMTDRGYTSEDANFLGDAMSKGGIHHSAFTTRRMGELAEGGGSRGEGSGTIEGFPSAAEFRADQKKNIGRDGSYRGGYGKNDVTFGRAFYRETGQTNRPDEDFDAVERPQEVIEEKPQDLEEIGKRNVVLEGPEVTGDIIPPPTIEEKPDPVVQEKPVIRGCMDPKSTNYNPKATEDDGSCVYPQKEEEKKTPAREPLGRFDMGAFEPMPSDHLGTVDTGAMGRYSDAMLGSQMAGRAGVNRMGSALRAKLNSLGRKYNTMGSSNPRGMRFVKRR